MKLRPRDYQSSSVDQTAQAIAEGVRRPLMLLPTASGKSIIIALIVDRYLKKNPMARVLVLCHQGHLLAQNEEKINIMNSEISTGIYCAGQGRKDRLADVILASRDSLGNNPMTCGDFDLFICDEAHMISTTALSEKDRTQYGKIFKAHDVENKIVVGLTGTGWRLNRGVIWGEGKFFEKVSYNVPMRKLINEGYLCPYVFPDNDVKVIDSSELSVQSTGDYKTEDLEKISMPEEIVERCLDLWEQEASERKVSIFFTCSRPHGAVVTAQLGERIGSENVAYIDGATTKAEREVMFEDIKRGRYRAIINIGVLTTGFDAPIIDCVVWLRATESVSLFVQMGGRGLRMHDGKHDCLMLDMAGNFDRFNSLEEPFGHEGSSFKGSSGDGSGEGMVGGDAPSKSCPRCNIEGIAIAAKTCPMCGFLFINHKDKAHSKVKFEFLEVDDVLIMENETTRSGKKCVKVYYLCEGRRLPPQTLLIHDNNWPGPIHRQTWDMLKKNDPLKVQIYNNPKTNYPEISVIDWVPKKTEYSACQHEWDAAPSKSDGGPAIIFCQKCGEIK